MTADQSPTLILLLASDDAGQGHIYEYAKAVETAAHLLEWNCQVAISATTELQNPPPHWSACLEGCRGVPKLNAVIQPAWQRALSWVRQMAYPLARSFQRYLRQQLQQEGEVILFMDTFGPPELIPFALSLLGLPRQQLSVWLLYRYRNYQRPAIGNSYRFCNWLIEKSLPAGRFKLLTDSDLLAQSESVYFSCPVTVMPIPHTPALDAPQSVTLPTEVLSWWPGQPRVHKGWDIIRSLTQQTDPQAAQLTIVAAQSSGLQAVPQGPQVKLIADYLPRQDYLDWFSKAHLVLLPYDVEMYQLQTSGIFVEAICIGKMPLVSRGTWMDYELQKFGLADLALDWEQDGLIHQILAIAHNASLWQKLQDMSQAYRSLHSVQSYARQMQTLVN